MKNIIGIILLLMSCIAKAEIKVAIVDIYKKT